MHRRDFEAFQREYAHDFLTFLAGECRQAYLQAAHLIEHDSESVRAVRERWHDGTVNLWGLMETYAALASRYADDHFSCQEDLIPSPAETADMKWTRYLHHRLVPALLQDAIFVRNVLRAACLLPDEQQDPPSRSAFLRDHARDFPMPDADPTPMVLQIRS
jgi:hypothetical protein